MRKHASNPRVVLPLVPHMPRVVAPQATATTDPYRPATRPPREPSAPGTETCMNLGVRPSPRRNQPHNLLGTASAIPARWHGGGRVKLPEPRQLPDGRWWMRYSAPPGPGGKRRQPRVYGRTAKECRENYVTAMGDTQAGRLADDRRTKFADYLDRRVLWWESEDHIKPSTRSSSREAIELDVRPGLVNL